VIEAAHEKAKVYLRKSASSIMETIERLPYSIQKISKGMEHNIDPVVLGGYINAHLTEISKDAPLTSAFALAVWPYLKNSNVTNDALASVAGVLSSLLSNQSQEYYRSVALIERLAPSGMGMTSAALDSTMKSLLISPGQNFKNVAEILKCADALDNVSRKLGIQPQYYYHDANFSADSMRAIKALKAYMRILSCNNNFTPTQFAASQQKGE